MFPKTVYVQWTSHDGQPTWKLLCTIYDNESLFWIEQQFTQSNVTFKITPTRPPETLTGG